MIRTWWIALWLLLVVAASGKAQPTQLRFEHLTVNQGLSNHLIYAMLQDSYGYLWFATDNGLYKYDGYTLVTYKKIPGDTTSLAGNSLPQLMEDRDGNLWIGMMGQGMCKFDRRTETFTCYPPTPLTLRQGSINSLCEDQEGFIWVTNGQAELRRFDKKTGTYSRINYASLLSEPSAEGKPITPIINTIYRDKTGYIWLCSDRGLYRMQVRTNGQGKPPQVSFTTYRHDSTKPGSLSHDKVWEAYEDRAGTLWVSTENGINRFDRKRETFTIFPYRQPPPQVNKASINRHFRHFAEDQQGNLWLGCASEGLFRFDTKRMQFDRIRHNPVDRSGLSSDCVLSLLVDRSGLLWVGTYGKGIDIVNLTEPFQHYEPLPYDTRSLHNEFVQTILEDRSGTVWIGTGFALNRLDQRTGQFVQYRHSPIDPTSLPNWNVEAMLEDREGNLWVASGGELALFDPKAGTFTCLSRQTKRYPGLSGQAAILTLYEDRQGLLWLGTTYGLKSFNPKTGQVVYYAPQQKNGISDAHATSILEDDRGNLWIGTGSVALNRLDRKTGRFTYYRPDRHKPGSITSDGVPCITQDSKGNLWFGTLGGGLCRFDYRTETFQAFTQANGLADNTIFSITEDNQGNLWLATTKGLSRFSANRTTFSNYDVNDGLQSNGFRHAHCKAKDGTLYFGGNNGFTVFNPRQLTINRHVPPLAITQIKLFDTPLTGKTGTDTIELTYDQNFLSFEFAAMDYTNPAKNQYAYKLDGLEPDWVHSGSRRYVSYTNLASGTYVFRVRGSNNDGVWNDKGVALQVIIHPPWWQTTWFRLLAGLCFVLLAIASVRLYTRARLRRQRTNLKRVLQAQEEERQRLAADLHDDLGATLSVIKGQLQTLHRTHEGLEGPIQLMKKAIIDLRHISHHLMPPEFVRLGLVEAIREIVRRAEAGSDIRFLFISFGQERRLDHETELTIYRIAVELINNAIKHAGATQITIQLIFYPQYVSLLVEDDGRGYAITAQNEQFGIGLRNIRSRVAYLKSKLAVDSGEAGTTITLEVPY
ncbi:ligand-binding sensor domain-containing protein [Fibrisoma limi]|nr:two-component regulator propeller domain-containing protein [Fibrisoma limi]